jgi:TonB family protein
MILAAAYVIVGLLQGLVPAALPPTAASVSGQPIERSVRARGNLVQLFSTDDYPAEAIQKLEEGTVAVTLRVDETGRVADCIVDQSSGSPSLDVQTCRILWARARFEPARDAKGNPVEDTWRQRIRWELPDPQPTDAGEFYLRHIVSVDPSKAVVGCKFESSPAWADREGCPDAIEQARQLVSLAPAWIEFAGRDVVVEWQYRMGNSGGRTELGEGAGEAQLMLSHLLLTISADGNVLNCSKESWGAVKYSSPSYNCELARRWKFEPLPKSEKNRSERQLTVVTAAYTRPSSKPPAS